MVSGVNMGPDFIETRFRKPSNLPLSVVNTVIGFMYKTWMQPNTSVLEFPVEAVTDIFSRIKNKERELIKESEKIASSSKDEGLSIRAGILAAFGSALKRDCNFYLAETPDNIEHIMKTYRGSKVIYQYPNGDMLISENAKKFSNKKDMPVALLRKSVVDALEKENVKLEPGKDIIMPSRGRTR